MRRKVLVAELTRAVLVIHNGESLGFGGGNDFAACAMTEFPVNHGGEEGVLENYRRLWHEKIEVFGSQFCWPL